MNPAAPTLLISDDDPDLREALAEHFVAHGYSTVLAGDGQEAFDLVRCRQVHLVLLDFHMPRMTGLRALELIKSYRRELPVILMSARLDHQMSLAVRAADAWAVHAKPVDVRQMRHDISTAIKTIYNWAFDEGTGHA
jgi:CheY-like chemotaxis protein